MVVVVLVTQPSPLRGIQGSRRKPRSSTGQRRGSGSASAGAAVSPGSSGEHSVLLGPRSGRLSLLCLGFHTCRMERSRDTCLPVSSSWGSDPPTSVPGAVGWLCRCPNPFLCLCPLSHTGQEPSAEGAGPRGRRGPWLLVHDTAGSFSGGGPRHRGLSARVPGSVRFPRGRPGTWPRSLPCRCGCSPSTFARRRARRVKGEGAAGCPGSSSQVSVCVALRMDLLAPPFTCGKVFDEPLLHAGGFPGCGSALGTLHEGA